MTRDLGDRRWYVIDSYLIYGRSARRTYSVKTVGPSVILGFLGYSAWTLGASKFRPDHSGSRDRTVGVMGWASGGLREHVVVVMGTGFDRSIGCLRPVYSGGFSVKTLSLIFGKPVRCRISAVPGV